MEKSEKQTVIPVPAEIIEKMKKNQAAWEQAMVAVPKSVIKNLVGNTQERMIELHRFEERCLEADRKKDPHRFDGFSQLLINK